MQFWSRNRGSSPLPVSRCVTLGYGVMAVTQDFDSWSPGSSPGSPTNIIMGVRHSWRGGADCKSVAFGLSRFESYYSHIYEY